MVVNDKLHYNNSHSIYSLMFLPVLSLSLLPTLLSVVVVSSCLYAFQSESRDHSIFPRGWLIYISGTWESILELMASLSTKLLL